MTANNGEYAHRRQELLAQQEALQGEKDRIGRDLREINEALEPEKFQPSALLPCLSADTLVWTPDGRRRIDSLQPGAHVLAFDGAVGCVNEQEVATVCTGTTDRFYAIRLGHDTIHATGSRRFWTEGHASWIAARDLEAGMHLRTVNGDSVPIDRVDCRLVMPSPTYNIEVTNVPTYFVGPGVLVHNQGPVRYAFGQYMIYEGRNPTYPDRVYIGQTNNLARREREHRDDARDRLAAGAMTATEQQFFRFMVDVALVATIMGLSEDQASYLEQKNIALVGRRALNRRQQANRGHMRTLEQRIANDQRVREQGYCI